MFVASQEILPNFMDMTVSKENKQLRAVSVEFASWVCPGKPPKEGKGALSLFICEFDEHYSFPEPQQHLCYCGSKQIRRHLS